MTWVHFDNPLWLVALIPALAALWHFRHTHKMVNALRLLTAVLLVLALSGLGMRKTWRSGQVVVLLDRSLSMPDNTNERHLEIMRILAENMNQGDRLTGISFAEFTQLEGT